MVDLYGSVDVYHRHTISGIIRMANKLTPHKESKVDFKSFCFICGEKLSSKSSSQEHIIPQWLLREFDIYKTKMKLPNYTNFRLGQSKITCCKECNGKYMSRVEGIVKQILNKQIADINDEDEFYLFMWFSKIITGLGLKMTTLKQDITNPNSEMIMQPERVNWENEIFAFPKLMRYPATFVHFKPFSFYKFELLENHEVPVPFILQLSRPVILLVYKRKGFLMVLGDGGLIKEHFPKITKSCDNPGDLLVNFSTICTLYSSLRPTFYYDGLKDETGRVYIVKHPDENLNYTYPFMPFDKKLLERNIKEHFKKWEMDIDFAQVNDKLRYWNKKSVKAKKTRLKKKRKADKKS